MRWAGDAVANLVRANRNKVRTWEGKREVIIAPLWRQYHIELRRIDDRSDKALNREVREERARRTLRRTARYSQPFSIAPTPGPPVTAREDRRFFRSTTHFPSAAFTGRGVRSEM